MRLNKKSFWKSLYKISVVLFLIGYNFAPSVLAIEQLSNIDKETPDQSVLVTTEEDSDVLNEVPIDEDVPTDEVPVDDSEDILPEGISDPEQIAKGVEVISSIMDGGIMPTVDDIASQSFLTPSIEPMAVGANEINIISITVDDKDHADVKPNDKVSIEVRAEVGTNKNWKRTSYKIGNETEECVDTKDYSGTTGTVTFDAIPKNIGENQKLEIKLYGGNNCYSSSISSKTLQSAITYPYVSPNPEVKNSCGLDIALVIDYSGSIDANELEKMKTALKLFVTALEGTPTQFSVTKFGTNATKLLGFTSDTSKVIDAINSVQYKQSNGTNWKEAIKTARETFGGREDKPNLMIIATDGNPTYPDCGGSSTCDKDVLHAVSEANTTKEAGIRMLALGIGDGLNTENLKYISGPNVNSSELIKSDVITASFDTMAGEFKKFATQTCGGTISVNKYIKNEGEGDDKYVRGKEGWEFTIKSNNTSVDTIGTGEDGTGGSKQLNLGEYSIGETNILDEYSFGKAECFKGGKSTGSPSLPDNGVAGIVIGIEDIVTCNFYNIKENNTGSITLIKSVTNDNGGNATFEDFTLKIGNETVTSGDKKVLPVGSYVINEEAKVDGYKFDKIEGEGCPTELGGEINLKKGDDITCTITNDDIQPKITVTKTVLGGNKGVSAFNLYVGDTKVTSGEQIGINTGTYTVREDADLDYNSVITGACDPNGSITLALGEEKECTITNTRKTGQISFVKNVTYGDAQPSNWVFAVYKEGEFVGNYTHDSSVALDTGVYTVQEIGPTPSLPYYLDSIGGTACSGTISSGIAELTVTESGGTCIFGNSKKPTITVTKVVNPTNSQDTFGFTIYEGNNNISGFTLGHGGTKTVDVMPGSYTITESGTEGYRAEIVCSEDITPTFATIRTISLSAQENKSCTFTNTKLGSISGTKWNDVNGDGIKDEGEEVVEGVQICIDANTNSVCDEGEVSVTTDASGNYTFSNLLPGTYTIIETLDSGWEQTYPAEGKHTVQLSAGEVKIDNNFGNWELKPGIKVVKSSTTTSITEAGQVVPYTFTVTNTGNQTLTGITVTDPRCTSTLAYDSGDTNNDSNLQTTEAWIYTCNYTAQQSDIDAGGYLSNTVTASSTEAGPVEDTLDIPVNQSPDMSVTKDADVESVNAAGQIITYTIKVFNKGNTTLTNVSVEDELLSDLDCDGTTGLPYTTSGLTINVGSSLTCTGTYTVTQNDIDSKAQILNTATAKNTVTDPETDNEKVDVVKNPELSIEKTGTFEDEDGDGFANVGETITYTFKVTNTGNQTLTGITVTDPLLGGTIASCAKDTLLVGDNTTCTATYAITQADIDAGQVYNTAIAKSTEGASDEDEETVELEQNPVLSIIKSGTWVDADGDGYANVGETITYIFTVKNEGNVTLTNVTVTDHLVTVNGGPITLNVGETDSSTFTATYTITQYDIDIGSFYNIATANSAEKASDTDDETVKLPQNPALSIEKTGVFDDGDDDITNPGDLITYTFKVTNIGNLTLTGITVTDLLLGGTIASCSATVLEVGKNIICTATYEITQADIDAGEVYNIATADSEESEEVTDDETVILPQTPALNIVKTATPLTYSAVGDEISYTYQVTNTGNVTMHDIVVEDDKVTVTCPGTTLAVGEDMTCTASYTIVLADLDEGSVTNIAYATDGETKSEPDTETVTSIAGKITIRKEVSSESEQIYEQEFEFNPSWTENFFLTAGQSKGSDWLVPGTYNIVEIVPIGWILDGMECTDGAENSNGKYFTMRAENGDSKGDIILGDKGDIICVFTNRVIEPHLQIEKSNNKQHIDQHAGDEVTYTITVTAPEREGEGQYLVKNVKVSDIAPAGFAYLSGTWTAQKNGSDITIPEPTYDGTNPAIWAIGEMKEGDIVVLTYRTKISLLQNPGKYPDIAWVGGDSLSGKSVLGVSAINPATRFVGTDVTVIEPIETEEGEVLGASITLPATGASTYLTLGALLMMILGTLTLLFKPFKKFKYLFLASLMAISFITLTTPNRVLAANDDIKVRIMQPATPTNKTNFNIGFVALDLKNNPIIVECYKDSETTPFATFPASTGNCPAKVSASGTYTFYVKALSGSGEQTSASVVVDVNLGKPSPVINYSKTGNVLKFKTANDGKTEKVEIFRSEKSSFTANASTRIHVEPVSPDTEHSWTDTTAQTGKTYYYALRAVDAQGNVSSIVSDPLVVTIPATPTQAVTGTGADDSTTTPPTEEKVEGETSTEGEVAGEADTKVEGGEVQGEEDGETEGEESDIEKATNKFLEKWYIWVPVIILIGGTIYYVRRKKTN